MSDTKKIPRHPNFEPVFRAVRAGQLPITAISRQHNVSRDTVHRWIKEYGLKRDLSDHVKSAINAEVTNAIQITDGQPSDQSQQGLQQQERLAIKEAAELGMQVILSHRKDIRKARNMTELLLSQLHEAALYRGEIEADIEETADDKRRYNRMMKAVSLPGHSGVLRDLSMALKNLIPLERQAFGLEETPEPDEPDAIIIVDQSC
ncbi:MAG: helix-turn-helix domain-containing protein [Desulfurivibrionaceae bacterium]